MQMGREALEADLAAKVPNLGTSVAKDRQLPFNW